MMASESKKRELFKGSLQRPKRVAHQSYTQKPASNEEVFILSKGKKDEVIAVEFNSRAIPQPFLDPSVMQLRQKLQKQWIIEEERAQKAKEGSGVASPDS